MNQDATLAQMRELKLIGMAQAFEALCLLPIMECIKNCGADYF